MNPFSPRDSEHVRLAIIEDETLIREGLVCLFTAVPDIACWQAASDPLDVLREAEFSPPDVVLFDLTLPDGVAALGLRLWQERLPQTRLLLFDQTIRDVNLRWALQLRAAGYVTKADRFVDIVTAIRQAARGQTFFTDEVQRRLRPTPTGWVLDAAHDRAGLHSLTNRETEVLKHLAQGLSVKQCSAVLSISPSTVDNHKARIMKKLNIRKMVDLARLALREGLTSH